MNPLQYRDITAIPQSGDSCVVIQDDQTVVEYNSSSLQAQTFKLISNKYYLVRDQPYVEPDDRQYQTCVDTTTMSTLPGKYDFLTPFYQTTAILSAVLIILIAFRIFIYPFFRRKL